MGQAALDNRKLVNVLRGIIPTFTDFDTNPTSPENCTDENINTVTGTGTKTTTRAANIGKAIFDLGSSKRILLGGRLGMWSSAGAMRLYILVSEDGTTFNYSEFQAIHNTVTSTTKVTSSISPAIISGRHIQLLFTVNAAATANVELNEIVGYEL